MATRSRPKNFGGRPGGGHAAPATREQQLEEMPVPVKPHPGYPGHGPPLPGRDHKAAAALRTPPGAERYYPEWSGENIRSSQAAEQERLAAERLLRETKDLIADARLKSKHDAKEVEERFRQRVGDISFWKSELEAKLGEVKSAADDADSLAGRVEQALAGCAAPADAADKCLAYRAQRQGMDRVEDNVQKHLQFEAETVRNSQVLLRQTQMQVLEEIRQLHKCRHTLERDLADKEAALDIDQHTQTLRATAPGQDKRRGVGDGGGGGGRNKDSKDAGGGSGVFSPADWQAYSEKNLQLASAKVKSSIELDAMVDGVLAHVASHLKSQKDLTDRAFERRLKEVKEAKRIMEEQLSETVVKVGEVEESTAALERAVAAKQHPLATCQLRIQQRRQRPNHELVLDDVDVQLQREAENLADSVNRMEAQLTRSRGCYASLQRSRLELEEQIRVKTNSIYIDEVKCKTVRQAVDIRAY